MAKRIFDIDNERVVISPNVLLIPEFRKLTEIYKEPIAALSYIYFMTYPDSPYSDVPEADKPKIISEDVGGDFGLDDVAIEDALRKADMLFMTPTRRFLLKNKIAMEKLGDYLASTEITEGLHGNFAGYQMSLTRTGKIMEEFKKLEKMYDEESNSGLRGSGERSFDE